MLAGIAIIGTLVIGSILGNKLANKTHSAVYEAVNGVPVPTYKGIKTGLTEEELQEIRDKYK